MNLRQLGFSMNALVIASILWQNSSTLGQDAPRPKTAAASADPQEAERRTILESDRWRRTHRNFNEWLAIQQVYTPEQVAAIREELATRIARMSPRELQDFLKDMEERLAVLSSTEAEDARRWLADFFAVARNPEAQLGRRRPDVLNMTASQIRQELQWLQEHRAARQQSHAAFNQGRALQKQSALGVQQSRQQGQEQFRDVRSRAADVSQRRSEYAPRPQDRANFTDFQLPTGPPIHSVSPWGTPIYWHPMYRQW